MPVLGATRGGVAGLLFFFQLVNDQAVDELPHFLLGVAGHGGVATFDDKRVMWTEELPGVDAAGEE